jgi:hypothetical protein
MRSSLLLLSAALATALFPLPARAVRPWHSEVTKHPVGLSDATPLRGINLQKKALTETKRNGPQLHVLPRKDRLRKYVSTPQKRGGGRSASDPLKGARRGASTGAKVAYNRTRPFSDHGRLPQPRREHTFTVPH